MVKNGRNSKFLDFAYLHTLALTQKYCRTWLRGEGWLFVTEGQQQDDRASDYNAVAIQPGSSQQCCCLGLTCEQFHPHWFGVCTRRQLQWHLLVVVVRVRGLAWFDVPVQNTRAKCAINTSCTLGNRTYLVPRIRFLFHKDVGLQPHKGIILKFVFKTHLLPGCHVCFSRYQENGLSHTAIPRQTINTQLHEVRLCRPCLGIGLLFEPFVGHSNVSASWHCSVYLEWTDHFVVGPMHS